MQRIYNFLKLVFAAALFLSLAACSSLNPFSSEPAPEAPTEQQQPEALPEMAPEPVQPAPEEAIAPPPRAKVQKQLKTGPVELIWQVSGQAVEKYHLSYGYEASRLVKKISIPVTSLEKMDHPTHGPVFRFVLGGIPLDQTLYFTIEAENDYGRSPPSPVQEIPPR